MSTKHCKMCTNAGTAYCKECMVIENSKGESDPSNFVCGWGNDPRFLRKLRISDLAELITYRIARNHAVPLKWLVEYNKLIEEEYCERT